jgi:hypothetical protein
MENDSKRRINEKLDLWRQQSLVDNFSKHLKTCFSSRLVVTPGHIQQVRPLKQGTPIWKSFFE